MTIAAGLVCQDAIVIAADTQETISGYMKQDKGKVRTLLYPHPFSFVVTGAGTSDYIEAAYQRLFDLLPTPENLRQIEDLFRARLGDFFDMHLARWSYFPENERPSVELLIGAAGNNHQALFHYSGTVLNRVTEAKAIGAGILLANSLLSQHHEWNHTADQTVSIATYILAKVKRQVDTCGGSTDLVVQKRNGEVALVSSDEIEALEKEYGAVEAKLNKELTQRIMEKKLGVKWLSNLHGN